MLLRLLEHLEQLVDEHNINFINLIFIGFTTLIVIFGSLINVIESRLPTCIRQSFRYGKHGLKGASDPLVTRLEVPKSWFSHFYVFALGWAVLALILVLKGFMVSAVAPDCVLTFLDVVAGGRSYRRATIDSTRAFVAVVLVTMQCGRRFYETNFVQIFSKKSKINLSHYLVGYIHYFGVIVALLANTEGFVRGSFPSNFSFSKLTLLEYVCIFIFHFSWTQQYKSNMILVNLRRDAKSAKVNSEQHFLPQGGYFNVVSSPHMFFEIVMYVALMGLLLKSFTWCLIAGWVFSNQMANGLLAHQWYKENFKNYPKERRAIIPFVL